MNPGQHENNEPTNNKSLQTQSTRSLCKFYITQSKKFCIMNKQYFISMVVQLLELFVCLFIVIRIKKYLYVTIL